MADLDRGPADDEHRQREKPQHGVVVHASPSMLLTPTGEGRPWLPVVSFVHAGADFVESLAVPAGSGHRYGSDQPDRLQTCD
ncbi:MAG: hypothetical protein ABIW49_12385 [Knoellia sp.]